MDKITQTRIEKLHPSVIAEVKKIIDECNTNLTSISQIRITQGFRTADQQAKLYAQGRTTPGKKVTNAKAGQSIHNYGLAVDICLMINGRQASWDTVRDWDNDQIADWYECVKIFAKYGWSWGGNWKKFKDLPHFEKRMIKIAGQTIPCTWRVLSKLPKDQNGYVIL